MDDLLGEYDDDVEGDRPEEEENKPKVDNTIPGPVAWAMFLRYKGYKSERELHRLRDCDVFRDYEIFKYMLARGLLSDYKM